MVALKREGLFFIEHYSNQYNGYILQKWLWYDIDFQTRDIHQLPVGTLPSQIHF